MNFIQLAIRHPAEVPTSVRYWLANRIHSLAVRLYDEQYWCNCEDPSCRQEVGMPLICTSSYVRDLDNQWNHLDLGSAGQLEDLTGELRDYIVRGEAGETGYSAYLGENETGRHVFLDSVQGIEWIWEDQPAGQPDTTPEAFPVYGQVETTNSYGIKLLDGHWFNYSMYGYTGNAHLGHHPAEPGDIVNMSVVRSRTNDRYFIKTLNIEQVNL